MEKKLGKIQHASFGFVGYKNSKLGVQFVLTGKDWGVVYFRGVDRYFENEDNEETPQSIMIYVAKLLDDAKVASIEDLKGIPIECEFEQENLNNFRILTEVI